MPDNETSPLPAVRSPGAPPIAPLTVSVPLFDTASTVALASVSGSDPARTLPSASETMFWTRLAPLIVSPVVPPITLSDPAKWI